MERGVSLRRGGRFSSYGKLGAIVLALLAIVSPLYIDREPASECETDDDDEPMNLAVWLPVLLLVLVLTITISGYLDRSLSRFDPYWIHRVGGSSAGITLLLIVLALVLKWKASLKSWEL